MTSLPNHQGSRQFFVSSEGLSKVLERSKTAQFPGQHVVWTDDLRHELPIRMGTSGISAEIPKTLIDEWKRVLAVFGTQPALSVKREGKWVTLTYQQYYSECMKFAQALLNEGCSQFATINLIGFNSPEWVIAYYGSMFARCIPVGIYVTNGIVACEYIARHSEAKIIVAENWECAKKYVNLLEKGELNKIILYDEAVGSNNYNGKVVSWNEFINSGKGVAVEKIQERMDRIQPGNCCTLIYTSGTTGMPKGVMLSHDNFVWCSKSSLQFEKMSNRSIRLVSYLPLSHAAGQFIDIVRSIMTGCHVFFADATALQGTLIQTLQEVKPQGFFSVPRVWEKIHGKMMEIAKANGPILSKIGTWAKSIGQQGTLQEARQQPTSWQFKLAKVLVYNRVKAALGLDECDFFIFGSAPLDPAIRKYFFSINFFLRNGYGMTECTAPQNSTDPHRLDNSNMSGYLEVGGSFPGTQTHIAKAAGEEEGQICMRGRNTFMGYFKNPEDTSKTIDSQGFLHSGDNGRITSDGVLFITGRVKELIITAGGENIPPVLIENQIKSALPCVANVMALGDNRKYLACLITLKEDPPMSGNLDKAAVDFLASKGLAVKNLKEAQVHPGLRKVLLDGLKVANDRAISRAQHVHDFYLLKEDFSVENGTLTPTLKLKRKEVLTKYAAEIQSLYNQPKL